MAIDIKNITEKIKKTTDDIVEIVKKKLDKKEKGHYLSGKEVRAIAKSNKKTMMALEKEKNRKKEESEYLGVMKDDNNILEIDALHTYFYTDQGIVKAVNGVSINIPKNSTVVSLANRVVVRALLLCPLCVYYKALPVK